MPLGLLQNTPQQGMFKSKLISIFVTWVPLSGEKPNLWGPPGHQWWQTPPISRFYLRPTAKPADLFSLLKPQLLPFLLFSLMSVSPFSSTGLVTWPQVEIYLTLRIYFFTSASTLLKGKEFEAFGNNRAKNRDWILEYISCKKDETSGEARRKFHAYLSVTCCSLLTELCLFIYLCYRVMCKGNRPPVPGRICPESLIQCWSFCSLLLVIRRGKACESICPEACAKVCGHPLLPAFNVVMYSCDEYTYPSYPGPLKRSQQQNQHTEAKTCRHKGGGLTESSN